VGLQVLLQSGLVVVLAVDGAVRLCIDVRPPRGQLAVIDGLRKLKRFSPANVNRAQNFVGRWMDDPTSQRRCHASLLSLAHNV
jgi:hypothetical protein